MDLMHARVAMRERPLLDILDLAVRFCAANAAAFAKLSLAVLVPALAVSWLAAWAGGWVLGWTVAVVLTAFAGAPFVTLASLLVFEHEVRVRAVLRQSLRALPRLVGARFVQLAALGGSVLMLGLPWLWVGTILLFVVEVIALEHAGVGAALGRAHRIANAHFGTALVTMLLLLLAPAAAALLADFAGREVLESLLELKPPPSVFQAGGNWLALLGWWGALPLLCTARFFVYLDIRTRTEGWDIQTRFASIASRDAAGSQERRAA